VQVLTEFGVGDGVVGQSNEDGQMLIEGLLAVDVKVRVNGNWSSNKGANGCGLGL